MSQIVPFVFESHHVRVVTDERGEPLFVGVDVCKALGYVRHSDAMQLHCKGAATYRPLQTAGGNQKLRVLTEPDVLRLIIGSTLPSAVAFERWVFEEVLPSIRKTGAYLAPGATLDSLSPEIRAQIGGIVKAVVGKQVSDALTVSLPALVSAELARRDSPIAGCKTPIPARLTRRRASSITSCHVSAGRTFFAGRCAAP